MLEASPKQMKDGSWGATVKGKARIGDQITVITRSGKQWIAEVSEVVWVGTSQYGDTAGDTVSLCKLKGEN